MIPESYQLMHQPEPKDDKLRNSSGWHPYNGRGITSYVSNYMVFPKRDLSMMEKWLKKSESYLPAVISSW